MLKKATAENEKEILSFLSEGVVSLKIASYIKAYGFERDFINYWLAFSEENELISVFALFETSAVLYAEEGADLTELRSFIEMLGFETLVCSEKTAYSLGFEKIQIKKTYFYDGEADEASAEEIEEEKIKDVYNLICENIPDSFEKSKNAYLSFLSDYTFRKRRSLARGKCITENGKVLSSAITAAETESAALISGVASDRSAEKKASEKERF